MQREEKIVTTLAATVCFILISIIIIGMGQCVKEGKTAAEHERNILNICQAVPLSDYTNCLRREWDRVNDVPDWMKEKR